MSLRISVENFCEKHNVSPNLFYQFRYNNKNCEGIHKEQNKKNIWIDEKWFSRRKDFKEKIYQANQDLYYDLKERDVPIARAVEYIAKKAKLSEPALNTHFSSNIWTVSMRRDSVFNNKIGTTYWLVYRTLARYNIEEILKRIEK